MGRNLTLLKLAYAHGAGELVGKALRGAAVGAKKVMETAGDIGEGVAKGVGANETAGRHLAQAAVVAPVAVGAADSGPGRRLRARTGIMTPSDYGTRRSDY